MISNAAPLERCSVCDGGEAKCEGIRTTPPCANLMRTARTNAFIPLRNVLPDDVENILCDRKLVHGSFCSEGRSL